MKSLLSIKLIFTLVILVGLSSCLEKEEGCLDPNAINLDVTADVNANCNYPNLRFNISHRWIDQDTVNFRLDEQFVLDSGDTIVFSEFQWYISSIRLGGAEGLSVFDSVVTEEGTYISDDLTLLSASNFQLTLGHIDDFGEFDELAFDAGFNQHWKTVDTTELENLESNHPWLNETMRAEGGLRYQCKMSYVLYNADTLSRSFGLSDSGETETRKQGNFNIIRANHADIGLLIDYRQLLDGIDMRDQDEEGIKVLLLQNMNSAIQIVQ